MEQNESNKPKKFRALLIDYVSKNPLVTLWSIVLVLGGMFGYIHYTRIGYIPEIDIKSAGTILISLALTGVFFTAAFGAIFLVPAIYFRSVGQNYPNLVDTSILEDPYALERKMGNRRIAKLVIRSSITALGAYSFVFGVISWDDPIGKYLVGIGIVVITSMMLVFDMVVSWLSIEKKEVNKNGGGNRISRFFSKDKELIGATIIWFCSFLYVFLFADKSIFSNIKLALHEKVLFSVVLLLTLLLANVVGAIPGLSKAGRFATLIILGILASPLLFLLAVPNGDINLEKLVFRKLGLGSMPDTIFFVNSDACMTVNFIRPNTCTYIEGRRQNSDGNGGKSLGCITPQYLENRLGSEYLLVFNDEGKEKGMKSFSIPIQKKDVVQWGFLNNNRSDPMTCLELKTRP